MDGWTDAYATTLALLTESIRAKDHQLCVGDNTNSFCWTLEDGFSMKTNAHLWAVWVTAARIAVAQQLTCKYCVQWPELLTWPNSIQQQCTNVCPQKSMRSYLFSVRNSSNKHGREYYKPTSFSRETEENLAKWYNIMQALPENISRVVKWLKLVFL